MLNFIKKKPLLTLLVILITICIISLFYSVIVKEHIKADRIHITENGDTEFAPFPPSIHHPLGTDRGGNDLVLRVLDGAKYTIFFITIVSLARIIISITCAYLLVFPLKKVSNKIQLFLMPFQYIPAFVLVNILSPDLIFLKTQMGYTKMIIIQLLIIIFVGFPILINTVSNEMKEIVKSSYIEASMHLGASNWRILTKHIVPVMKNRLISLFLQQISANLLLLIHLGVFKYFIGGIKPGNIAADPERDAKYLSQSGEWAGMIGQSINDILTAPWILFSPLLLSVIFLIIVNLLSKQEVKIGEN
ncbi:ABC transporter permease subunit [Peribacillus sp. B-H-3]|uniref:ABC transporter permease subunit n=1 Tax=Peribacillus sp. B-H-3 TaxID=3400420 RepID=UPI003B02BD3E